MAHEATIVPAFPQQGTSRGTSPSGNKIASHAAQPRSPDAKFVLSRHAQLSAGARAIETKAKISGLMTQKIELAVETTTPNIEQWASEILRDHLCDRVHPDGSCRIGEVDVGVA